LKGDSFTLEKERAVARATAAEMGGLRFEHMDAPDRLRSRNRLRSDRGAVASEEHDHNSKG
jgi:hypothetical protein